MTNLIPDKMCLGFWIVGVLNIPGLWLCFWFWTTVVNMAGLYKVLNMPEYAWIIPGYAWLCLNVPKSLWMAFVLHLPIAIPCLKEPLSVFLKSKNCFFFYSSWRYLILFFVLDWIFLQVKFQICYYFWGPRGLRVGNLDIPNQWYTQ